MGSCCGGERRRVETSLTSRYSEWVLEALEELPYCFLMTDPAIAGHPIVFASAAFVTMSGYARADEVLGRNARIFQGPATDRRAVAEIREAVRAQRAAQLCLLNYRRDGTPHWVLFHMTPVFAVAAEAGGDAGGQVLHFLAVQVPIPRRKPAARCGAVLSACREEARIEEDPACSSTAREVFVDVDKRGLEAEEPPVAGDWEKEKVLNAVNSIFSVLNCYSKLTGVVVCGRRCGCVDIPALSSSLNLSLGRIKQSFVLTDRHLPDMPIVYASDAFLSLTGYFQHEVLGRNCRFLNGPDTSLEVLEEINNSICSERACTVHLLNYRKDGSSFSNLVHISPVRNATGKVAFYVWVHLDEGSKTDFNGLSPEVWQLGAVGAVKVAVRSLSASGSLLRPSQ